MSTQGPPERLVLSYLGDKEFHRGLPDDDSRPACRPNRIRGVPMMKVKALRTGLAPCRRCWPDYQEHEAPVEDR